MSRWFLRKLMGLATIAVIGAVGLATSVATHASAQPGAVTAYTMTPKRMAASSAALVALIGAVVGGLALARSRT
jgi:hypothetical protein